MGLAIRRIGWDIIGIEICISRSDTISGFRYFLGLSNYLAVRVKTNVLGVITAKNRPADLSSPLHLRDIS